MTSNELLTIAQRLAPGLSWVADEAPEEWGIVYASPGLYHVEVSVCGPRIFVGANLPGGGGRQRFVATVEDAFAGLVDEIRARLVAHRNRYDAAIVALGSTP